MTPLAPSGYAYGVGPLGILPCLDATQRILPKTEYSAYYRISRWNIIYTI